MFISLLGYSLRRLARLDKKNDERLTAYYIDFMAMCRRVCGQATEEDAGRGLYTYHINGLLRMCLLEASFVC